MSVLLFSQIKPSYEKQEHTRQQPAAIIELKVIAPTIPKMQKNAVNRPF